MESPPFDRDRIISNGPLGPILRDLVYIQFFTFGSRHSAEHCTGRQIRGLDIPASAVQELA